jgi:DNA processing protein
MPGSIHAPLAQGCHALIRDGAKLTATPLDVLEEYGLGEPAAQAGGTAVGAGSRSDREDASGAATPRAGERRTGAAASPDTDTDTVADAPAVPPRTACAPANDPAERAVLAALGYGPVTYEWLAEHSDLPDDVLHRALLAGAGRPRRQRGRRTLRAA